ncbi:type II CAAX prenyl endopeptidase Rce1 family protein [Anaerococcus martiniensis]|uniref:CPBP family glutamic-type intramembrane protease n=1 Tax=Anaerococcus sp. WGS1579 TaxID=3366809 RepID=UPI00372D6F32
MESQRLKLFFITIIFILLSFFAVKFFTPLFLFLGIIIAAIYLLIKNKEKLTKKDLIVATIMSFLGSLNIVFIEKSLLAIVLFAIIFITYIGSVTVFKNFLGWDKLLNNNWKKSLIIATAIGLILGFINLGGAEIKIKDPTITPLLIGLQAGIMEEISFRFIFYALSIYILRGKEKSIVDKILIYAIMTLPHAIAHGFDIRDLIGAWFVFAMPLAILQKKSDLTSSITTHFIIDLIRFSVLGI